MRKHIIYRYFLFLSLVGLMQLTFSCSSSSNEIEPLKPEGEDTPLEKDEYTFMEFSMFVRENLLLIRRLSVLDTVVRRNGVKRLANC